MLRTVLWLDGRSNWIGGQWPVTRDNEIGVGILRVLFRHGKYGSEGGQCKIICSFHLAHFVTLYIMHLSAR